MIWLIGNKGMLGTEISRMIEARGLSYVGTDREVDITNPASLMEFASAHPSISWIINCAAYTAVDKAEDDTAICALLNTDGPAHIASMAKKIGAKLIHISTDYVFHGDGNRPYREDDPTDPTGVYGLTKRDGESRALAENDATYIVRTAWLYGVHGNNFVFTMLRLMKERDTLSVVNDQRGTPTWAADLARTLLSFIDADGNKNVPYGIYHYTNQGNITWYDFACEIYKKGRALGLLTKDCAINPCTSDQFPAKVRRPPYSVLDKSKIEKALSLEIPQWESSLENFLHLAKLFNKDALQ